MVKAAVVAWEKVEVKRIELQAEATRHLHIAFGLRAGLLILLQPQVHRAARGLHGQVHLGAHRGTIQLNQKLCCVGLLDIGFAAIMKNLLC